MSLSKLALSKKGYECKLVHEPLKCGICNHIPREPHTVTCCNENFCKSCIENVEQKWPWRGRCPRCGKSNFGHTLNKGYQKVLLELEVFCTNKCGMKFPLKYQDGHLNISPPKHRWLEGCPLVKIRCIYCNDETKIREVLVRQVVDTFTLKKLEDVYKTTISASSKWNQIGHELDIDSDILREIEMEDSQQQPPDENCEEGGQQNTTEHMGREQKCYKQMLEIWLQSNESANWINLIEAFQQEAVQEKLLALKVGKAILCEKSANQLVKKECEMSKKTRKEFSTQRQLFDKLGTQLKHKRNYINDKQKELQELSRNKVQLQKTTGDELSKLTQQLERYEQKAKAIEKELQDSHEEQLRLLDQIGETEHQLKNTKDRMEQCKESLEKQIKDLEWEEDAKLRNRNLGGSERKPYTAEDYKKIAAAATAVGLGAAGATALFATTATGFVAGSAVVVPAAAVGGAVMAAKFVIKSEKEQITENYTWLIKKCINEITEISIVIDSCEKKLETLKEIVIDERRQLS